VDTQFKALKFLNFDHTISYGE